MSTKPKVTFDRWDTADHLRSEEDMAAYLDAALEEGDAALLALALGNLARASGMVQLAKDTGITREGLYKALSSRGNPSLDTVLKVVRALGLKLTPQPANEPAAHVDRIHPRAVAATGTTRSGRTPAKARRREPCPA